MLLITLQTVLILGSIVLPLIPKKEKIKPELKFRIDRDTTNAEYAIAESGSLERLHHKV
jgi:hypothetical protein